MRMVVEKPDKRLHLWISRSVYCECIHRVWGPVLVKMMLIIFTETELIKRFVQLILWCLLNIYFYSPNYFYVFYILFFTSFKS